MEVSFDSGFDLSCVTHTRYSFVEPMAFSFKTYRWKCLSWNGHGRVFIHLRGAVVEGETQGTRALVFPFADAAAVLVVGTVCCCCDRGFFFCVAFDGGRLAATVPASNAGEIPEGIGQLVVRGSLTWVLWLQNNYLSGTV